MPAGNNVRPSLWTNVIDLYDDGEYSAIWGTYNDSEHRCLGVRWNGKGDQGYPSQGGNPLWFVEPRVVARAILLKLLSTVNGNNNLGILDNIHLALREFQEE